MDKLLIEFAARLATIIVLPKAIEDTANRRLNVLEASLKAQSAQALRKARMESGNVGSPA